MRWKSFPTKGKGRGKKLGFPTINLTFPDQFPLENGIYAVWVTIDNHKYRGALHFGPVPTFGEKKRSLEVFLIDDRDFSLDISIKNPVEVETVKKIRDVNNFSSPQALTDRMKKDVAEAIILLHE